MIFEKKASFLAGKRGKVIALCNNKKAISAVIATVLIMLITISGTALIGTTILPMLKTNLDLNSECAKARISINLAGGYSCFYNDSQKAGVMLSASPGEFKLSGIQVVLKGGGKTESVEIRQSLIQSSEQATYLIATNLRYIEEVSAAPIVILGDKEKMCGVTSKILQPSFPRCNQGAIPTGIPISSATCSDAVQNGDEIGIDCGGSCVAGTETLCSDGIDNDKDCLIDSADSDCGPVTYRRPATITENSGSALTNHQVLITLDTTSLVSAGKMRSDCGDIRFFDTDGTTPLSYWVESGCNTGSTKIWAKVPNIPASSIKTIYVDYGDPSLASESSVPNTFIANSVYLRAGSCSSSTYCSYMDNHAEADVVRGYTSNICSNYVNRIYWGSVCDSSNPGSSVRENFYSDFKFLFLPDASGSWVFAVDSDDGSELTRNREDRDLDHTVITSWYSGHGWCNCQTHNGAISLTAGQAVWLEYLQEEWAGGEAAVVWALKPGGSWASLTAANFPNSLFARKYASPEPTTNVGAEI